MFNYKDEKDHWTDRLPTLEEMDRAKRDSCTHEWMKDFSCWSFGEERRIPHDYCPDCKCHWFDGEFYTPSRWEAYVNEC